MIPLQQRPNECSLAAIATLNELPQEDYLALSRLAREAGARFCGTVRQLREAIPLGVYVAKALGFYVPPNYPGTGRETSPPAPDFSGKGIVRIRYIRKRCRKYTHHVVTFKDGTLYESDGSSHPNWDAIVAYYKACGNRNIQILKIFK